MENSTLAAVETLGVALALCSVAAGATPTPRLPGRSCPSPAARPLFFTGCPHFSARKSNQRKAGDACIGTGLARLWWHSLASFGVYIVNQGLQPLPHSVLAGTVSQAPLPGSSTRQVGGANVRHTFLDPSTWEPQRPSGRGCWVLESAALGVSLTVFIARGRRETQTGTQTLCGWIRALMQRGHPGGSAGWGARAGRGAGGADGEGVGSQPDAAACCVPAPAWLRAAQRLHEAGLCYQIPIFLSST